MDLIPIIISLFSLLISLWAKKTADKANQISMGVLENSMRDLISQALRNMQDKGSQIPKILKGRKPSRLEYNEKDEYETAKRIYASAVEDWVTAYDDGCAKYLDCKIDRNRFRKTYKSDIKNLIEVDKNNKEIYDLLYPEARSKYRCIWKVYKEWEIEE